LVEEASYPAVHQTTLPMRCDFVLLSRGDNKRACLGFQIRDQELSLSACNGANIVS
jgi:hypothetical protein